MTLKDLKSSYVTMRICKFNKVCLCSEISIDTLSTFGSLPQRSRWPEILTPSLFSVSDDNKTTVLHETLNC